MCTGTVRAVPAVQVVINGASCTRLVWFDELEYDGESVDGQHSCKSAQEFEKDRRNKSKVFFMSES